VVETAGGGGWRGSSCLSIVGNFLAATAPVTVLEHRSLIPHVRRVYGVMLSHAFEELVTLFLLRHQAEIVFGTRAGRGG
jgi:hypothetical protein